MVDSSVLHFALRCNDQTQDGGGARGCFIRSLPPFLVVVQSKTSHPRPVRCFAAWECELQKPWRSLILSRRQSSVSSKLSEISMMLWTVSCPNYYYCWVEALELKVTEAEASTSRSSRSGSFAKSFDGRMSFSRPSCLNQHFLVSCLKSGLLLAGLRNTFGYAGAECASIGSRASARCGPHGGRHSNQALVL